MKFGLARLSPKAPLWARTGLLGLLIRSAGILSAVLCYPREKILWPDLFLDGLKFCDSVIEILG